MKPSGTPPTPGRHHFAHRTDQPRTGHGCSSGSPMPTGTKRSVGARFASPAPDTTQNRQ